MAQKYTEKNVDQIKAQILMGSTITRHSREIMEDGTSMYNYGVPTMTIGGTKDGMMRISRIAESYWHSHVNINA